MIIRLINCVPKNEYIHLIKLKKKINKNYYFYHQNTDVLEFELINLLQLTFMIKQNTIVRRLH